MRGGHGRGPSGHPLGAVGMNHMRYPDFDRLDEAIEHAREVAQTCGEAACAEEHYRLVGWLEELRLRRGHLPLRCRVGLHREAFQKGTAGRGRFCPLCGKKWFVSGP